MSKVTTEAARESGKLENALHNHERRETVPNARHAGAHLPQSLHVEQGSWPKTRSGANVSNPPRSRRQPRPTGPRNAAGVVCVDDAPTVPSVPRQEALGHPNPRPLQLNAGKSVRFSSCAVVRAELRCLEGPPVGVAFKDIGLDQHLGGSPPTVALERARQGQGRLDRLGQLALPWRVRCRMVAAAGVNALMFGAVVAALSSTAPVAVRRKVLMAILRTRFRAATETAFALLDVPRRCDVLAVAVAAPWDPLGKAVAEGHDARATLQLVGGSPRPGGPLHAAAVALRRCGITLFAGIWRGGEGRW